MTASISYLTDMDGVLIREGEMIPGADRFLRALHEHDIGANADSCIPRQLGITIGNRLYNVAKICREHAFISPRETTGTLRCIYSSSNIG